MKQQQVTGKQMIAVAGLFAALAALYAWLAGTDLVHEIGHAIFITIEGGHVNKITTGYVRATEYGDFGLYMGTGFSVVARALALIWLAGRRKPSIALGGWIAGRMVMAWLSWFIGNGHDAAMMSWSGRVVWTGLHVSAFAGFVLAALVFLIRGYHRHAIERIKDDGIARIKAVAMRRAA